MVSLLLFFFLLNSMASAGTENRPKAIIIPLTKDISTLQYITHIKQRTPSVDVPLIVDLGGDQSLWVDCETGFKSRSYKVIQCRTAPCSLAKSESCGGCFAGPTRQCYNDSCNLLPNNAVTDTSTTGVLLHDVVSLQSIGERSGQRSFVQVKILNFYITCAPSFMLEGLARGAKGMVGLGRTKIGMPSLLAAAYSFRRRLVLCLGSNGVVLFGQGAKMMRSSLNEGVFKTLNYTPMIRNPVTSVRSHLPGYPSSEYFIRLKSIKINNRQFNLNSTLLEIDSKGNGGTKLSTITPYTIMRTSIYKSVVSTFKNELAHVPIVTQVSPFSLCYNPASFASTKLGPDVPTIDLAMDGGSRRNVHWKIFGANSMVYVTEKVMCLGIIDGGESMKSSIVIGAQQLEDYLLEFDLATSRIGFSPSLLSHDTSCSSFNFNISSGQV